MGTLVEITWAGSTHQRGVDRAFEEIARLHRLFSAYDPASETSALNGLAIGERTSSSPDMLKLLQLCDTLWQVSAGRFRPTRHPCGHGCDVLPWAIEDTRFVCRRSFEELDFGGIAKGYVVDSAIRVRRSEGVEAAMVNAGGDASAYGADFAIRCRDPFATTPGVSLGTLRDQSIATTAPQGPTLDTAVVNPVTGVAACLIGSLSVTAQSCAVADGLTKVVLLAPDSQSAAAALDRFGATARFIASVGSSMRRLV